MVDFIEETVEREVGTLNKTIKALQDKINGDGYKYCQECGQEIPQKRREAFPAATRCIECATRFERGYFPL